jgi:death-on-curing protein
MPVKYIGAQAVLVIYAKIIDKTGGSHGVRDIGLVESAVAAPRQSFGGKKLYESVFAKAGVLLKKLAGHHPFVDGNKRTAFVSTALFLHRNGRKITTADNDVIDFTVRVVEDELEVEEIAGWLKAHTRKM